MSAVHHHFLQTCWTKVFCSCQGARFIFGSLLSLFCLISPHSCGFTLTKYLLLTNISITDGNGTGTHKHKINFNKCVLQFLPSPFLPHFNEEIKSCVIDYMLNTLD